MFALGESLQCLLDRVKVTTYLRFIHSDYRTFHVCCPILIMSTEESTHSFIHSFTLALYKDKVRESERERERERASERERESERESAREREREREKRWLAFMTASGG